MLTSAPVYKRSHRRATMALREATQQGNVDFTRFLLKQGADVRAKDTKRFAMSAIEWANNYIRSRASPGSPDWRDQLEESGRQRQAAHLILEVANEGGPSISQSAIHH